MAAWGGGIVSAVLLATPSRLPVSLFTDHHDVIVVATWWLANHSPFGIIGAAMRMLPVRVGALALLEIGRAACMCAVMDTTADLHPTATVAVFIMGSLPPVPAARSCCHVQVCGWLRVLEQLCTRRLCRRLGGHGDTRCPARWLWHLHARRRGQCAGHELAQQHGRRRGVLCSRCLATVALPKRRPSSHHCVPGVLLSCRSVMFPWSSS